MNLDYVIVNPNRKIFIKLNKSGVPVTCAENALQRFDKNKANNILSNLPKTMKQFHFKVAAYSESVYSTDEVKQNVIGKFDYHNSENVKKWVEKMEGCNGLANEVAARKQVLVHDLSNVDRELSNVLHEIELTKWKNGCAGYCEYKKLKIILEKRRVIKDELFVVSTILTSNMQSMATDKIKNVVDGLSSRLFSVREIEEYESI